MYDPRWPDLVHPFASAIDTPLPPAPESEHMMLESKANWVKVEVAPGDKRFEVFPDRSLEEWHRAHGLLDKP